MKRANILLLIVMLGLIPNLIAQEHPRLIIRSDDMGFSHGSNVANQQLLETGMPVNISVLFTGPWYREAVEILRQYDHTSIGVHLCANAEWKNFKWGPVASKDQVPSLLNEEGYFRGSYQELNIDHEPVVAEMEIEFRAQIERALATGLKIDYVDNHIGAGMHTPQQRAMVEKLAKEYGLGISGYWGEKRPGNFGGDSEKERKDKLLRIFDEMEAGKLYLVVFHLGIDGPEMQAMQDLNEQGVKNMSENRQWEMNILVDPECKARIEKHNIELVTYQQLIESLGLEAQQIRD